MYQRNKTGILFDFVLFKEDFLFCWFFQHRSWFVVGSAQCSPSSSNLRFQTQTSVFVGDSRLPYLSLAAEVREPNLGEGPNNAYDAFHFQTLNTSAEDFFLCGCTCESSNPSNESSQKNVYGDSNSILQWIEAQNFFRMQNSGNRKEKDKLSIFSFSQQS